MAKKLFIVASGQNIGKTTAGLSLIHLAYAGANIAVRTQQSLDN